MKHKTLVKNLFYNTNSKLFVRVNNFFASLTLLSIFFIVLETVESLASLSLVFHIVEYVTVFFFTLEYIARLYGAKGKIKYIFSFFGIVDLLAIVPSYFGMANLTFLKSVRIFRILRFMRMLRLAKIARFNIGGDLDESQEKSIRKLSLKIYFLALFSSVLLFGSAIYVLENSVSTFSNIPFGMLWALKLTLGGIGQVSPETWIGEIVAVSARFVGLLLFGLLIHIVGKSAERLLLGSRVR